MQHLNGIFRKLFAVACFVILATLVKFSSDRIPTGQAVFFRSIFALPVILGWIFVAGEYHTSLKTSNPFGHVWRGVIGTTAMALMFASLGFLPLAEVTAIGFTTPILLVVFSMIFLKEQVGIYRLSAVFIGLIGVIYMISPRLSVVGQADAQTWAALGAVFALASATAAALAQIQIRKLTKTEPTAAIVFYFSITSAILSGITAIWGWVWPTPQEWAIVISMGVIGGIGQIALTSAYRVAPVSLIAPFDYCSMVFAVIIGYVIFSELPSMQTVLGACVVIISGLFIIVREYQLGQKRKLRIHEI